MLEIKFEYRDEYTHGNWQNRSCVVEDMEECFDIYGLREPDVEYRILDVIDTDTGEEIDTDEKGNFI